MRPIDADALIRSTIMNPCHAPYIISSDVYNMPTIELERKTGNWIDDTYCSECGWVNEVESGFAGPVNKFNFCPNCGAYMKGEAEE